MSAQYARAQYFPSGLTQRQAVIAGLDPAIHPFREEILQKKMDWTSRNRVYPISIILECASG